MKINLRNTAIVLGVGAATATVLSLLKVNKEVVMGSTVVVLGAGLIIASKKDQELSNTVTEQKPSSYSNKSRIKISQRPKECPKCNHSPVAEIIWGLPDFKNPEFQKSLSEGKVEIEGCCISGDEPTWRCGKCREEIWLTHPRTQITCRETVLKYIDSLDVECQKRKGEVYVYINQSRIWEDALREEGGRPEDFEYEVIKACILSSQNIQDDLGKSKERLIEDLTKDIENWEYWDIEESESIINKAEYISNLKWDLIWNTLHRFDNKDQLANFYGISHKDVISAKII